MKILISIIVGLLAFLFIFQLDVWFIDYIISIIPKSAEEWYGLIRVILWVFTFFITLSLATLIGALVSAVMLYYFIE